VGRSLAAILAGLENGIVGAHWRDHEARIVIAGGRPLDAVAVAADQITMRGGEVLDELSALPTPELRVRPTSHRLALATPACWTLPGVVDVQLRWLDSAQILGQLTRTRPAGVILVGSATELGVVFLDDAGLVCAFTDRRPRPGGLEVLNHLLAAPEACLAARLHDVDGRPAVPETVQLVPATATSQLAEITDIEQRRQAILAMVHGKLELHAEPIARRFLAAPPTHDGLLAACEEVRRLQPRLVSAATIASIADRAQALLVSN
jgi:hypothetical protein